MLNHLENKLLLNDMICVHFCFKKINDSFELHFDTYDYKQLLY